MKRLDRNECIVTLHDYYNDSLWKMSDDELEQEFTKFVDEEAPYYDSPIEPMTTELTDEQKQAIEEMISRRMTNLDESREEATEFLAQVFEGLITQRSK